eukprot:230686-Hanusia_phi.AAC.1
MSHPQGRWRTPLQKVRLLRGGNGSPLFVPQQLCGRSQSPLLHPVLDVGVSINPLCCFMLARLVQ